VRPALHLALYACLVEFKLTASPLSGQVAREQLGVQSEEVLHAARGMKPPDKVNEDRLLVCRCRIVDDR
jgi:hypothetical protein